MFARIWEADYKGHTIRVENRAFGEKLWIDDRLEDAHSGLTTRAVLRGSIRDGDGAGEQVEAVLSGLLTVNCRLSVAGVNVPVSALRARSRKGEAG